MGGVVDLGAGPVARLPSWCLLPCSLILAVFTASSGSRAEPGPDEQARAEALFDEGKRLMEQKRFDDACPKLEESLKIEAAGGTLAALALCHQEQGRTATAWAEFKALLALANQTGHAARKTLAEEMIRELEPRLLWLLVEVSPEAAAVGVEVLLDGKALGRASWGVALPVDPGEHRLEARAPGVAPWTTSLRVGPAPERRSITVPPLLPSAPAASSAPLAPAASSALPPATPLAPASPPRSLTVPLVVGGLGAASVLVGGYFGVNALLLQQKANRTCPERACASDEAIGQSRDAIRSAWFANAGIGLGLAGLAAAYLLRPTPQERVARPWRVQLGGAAQPRGGGVVLGGDF